MLTLRRRGDYWHCRGTVRVGAKIHREPEHSTGCRERAAAENYVTRREHEIQEELLYGPQRRKTRLTFADAGLLYMNRPGGLHNNDVWRIGELNRAMGETAIADIADGWAKFKAERCVGLAVVTAERFRATAQAAINYACREWSIDAPVLGKQKFKSERIRWLTVIHQDRLLTSYVAHVRPIMLTLCYQGCRTQEALQLQWSNVRLDAQSFYFERTKSTEPRTVNIHARVYPEIVRLWEAQKKPDTGHVFLNRLGAPYSDTRDYKLPGGNPLRSAHATALAAARKAGFRPNGGEDFTVHDWRHHWASRCVMAGIDLETIKKQGGWKSLRMVEKYAAVSAEHMADSMRKLA